MLPNQGNTRYNQRAMAVALSLSNQGSLTRLLLIVPGDVIDSNGTEGITKLCQSAVIAHKTAIKDARAVRELHAQEFLLDLIRFPSHRIGTLELALIELERKGAWLIGFVPCLCGGIKMRV